MQDEPTGGQGQPTPGVAPPEPPAEPTPPTAPEPVQEVVQPKYSGKSLEDLANELAEKDRYISEVNERAARAEHEAMLTRNLVEQFAGGRGKPQEQAGPVDDFAISDDEFLTKPGETFKKGFQWMEARLRAERDRDRAESYVSSARQAYEQGKAEAVKSNPNLYRGIEADLSREVLSTVQSSLRSGQPVDASALRDPRYWQAAAVAMRIMKGEDVSKYFTKTQHPMAPAHQETPTTGQVPTGGVTLSPQEEELISRANITREQYLKAKETERDVVQRRMK